MKLKPIRWSLTILQSNICDLVVSWVFMFCVLIGPWPYQLISSMPSLLYKCVLNAAFSVVLFGISVLCLCITLFYVGVTQASPDSLSRGWSHQAQSCLDLTAKLCYERPFLLLNHSWSCSLMVFHLKRQHLSSFKFFKELLMKKKLKKR